LHEEAVHLSFQSQLSEVDQLDMTKAIPLAMSALICALVEQFPVMLMLLCP
jgi:hypothetical protein